MFEIGDMVQTKEIVGEENFMGQRLWIHAHAGAIGYVVGFEDGWPDVHWEHTGTGTLVDPDKLTFLCDAEGSQPRALPLSSSRHPARC